jgi:hypothetical protein
MAYTKTNWVPRQGTNLNKFTKSAESSTSVILVNSPDAVSQAGTPFSVENMNKIEQGILGAHDMIAALQKETSYGQILSFPFTPSSAEWAAWRLIQLAGQTIPISGEYLRLCNKMYVGDSANATAAWWYKTSDSAGNTRDVNGSYMKVLDHRGLFSRAAGKNSKRKMANNEGYDGGNVGAFIGDAIRNIQGYVATMGGVVGSVGGAFTKSETQYLGGVTVGGNYQFVVYFDASMVGPTGQENRPASISSYFVTIQPVSLDTNLVVW